MNYHILYTTKQRKLNIVETTMVEASELGNVINALQNDGCEIFAVFSTKEPF